MNLDFNSNVFAAYINLPHRTDRRFRMEAELQRVGITAQRAVAIKPDAATLAHPKMAVMAARNAGGGSVGCYLSQVAVIKEAYKRRQHALVLEDDLAFADTIQASFELIEAFTKTHEWDVIFLGCCFHPKGQEKHQWHRSINNRHTHPDMQLCACTVNADVEPTSMPYMVRAYGVWSTHAYIVNYESIPRILKLLDDNVHLSMGIDWLFMYLSSQMKQFAFVPGCVKQYDNQSDIGTGVTHFSAFKNLGPHWFQQDMRNFDYERFYKNLK